MQTSLNLMILYVLMQSKLSQFKKEILAGQSPIEIMEEFIKDKSEASKNVTNDLEELKCLTKLPNIMQKQILSGQSPIEIMEEFIKDQNEASKNVVIDLEEIKCLTELPKIMEK